MDEYTYFYLQWIEPFLSNLDFVRTEENYWERICQTAAWYGWQGYTFEAICLKHVDKIRKALKIDKIIAKIGSWRYILRSGDLSTSEGAQIDLLFDRADKVVTICEIKATNSKFTIDKAYAEKLRNKITVYRKQTKTTKQIFIVMITIHGLIKNQYAEELITADITLKDLFN